MEDVVEPELEEDAVDDCDYPEFAWFNSNIPG